MIYTIYNKILHALSPGEKGQYSSGYLHHLIRLQTLSKINKQTGRLLEVGCGAGLFVEGLASNNPKLEIFAIDNNFERLLKAKQRVEETGFKNVRFLLQDANILAFKEKSFDFVTCIGTLFNLPSLQVVRNVLAQIKCVAKDDAEIIIEFRNIFNVFLLIKYKLAWMYDLTVRQQGLPLMAYLPVQIYRILNQLGMVVKKKLFLGFIIKPVAPVIMLEVQKRKGRGQGP